MGPHFQSAADFYSKGEGPTGRLSSGFNINERKKTGIAPLDMLLRGGLLRGMVSLVHSPPDRKFYRHFLSQIAVEWTKDDNSLLFIDGGNCFPYYEIGEQARAQRLDEEEILSRIFVSRAFNYHQVTELCTEKLDAFVSTPMNLSVLVADMTVQYQSDEALQFLEYDKRGSTFALQELTLAISALKKVVLRENLFALVTTMTNPQSPSRKPLGGSYLRHSAGVIVQIQFGRSKDVYFLEKHPFLGNRVFEVLKSRQQSLLSYFR